MLLNISSTLTFFFLFIFLKNTLTLKFTMGFISFVGKYNRILENNIGAPKIKIKNQIVHFSNFAIAILVFSLSLFFALKSDSNKFSFTFCFLYT